MKMVVGTVKSFKTKVGYGFIKFKNEENCFVQYSEI